MPPSRRLLFVFAAATVVTSQPARPQAATPVPPIATAGSSQAGSTGESGPDPLAVPTTSSLVDPYAGSVLVEAPQPQILILSFDQALRLGLENNLGLVFARETESTERALRDQALNVLLPNISLHAEHGVHQFNLEAQGFRPSILPEFAFILPPGTNASAISLIAKANSTFAQVNYSQYLFDWSGYDALHALGHLEKYAVANSANSRATVILRVGTAYFQAIAEQAQVDNAQALLKQDEIIVYQTTERHKAGVVANLDEIRARVNYQTEQQALIQAQNSLAKAKIVLNRAIGLAPSQEIELAESSPYADLHVNSIEDATNQALGNREDYVASEEQVRAAVDERKAAAHERLPTVQFVSNYGVTGVVGQVYHGTWAATGTISVPIFQEGKFRSDYDQYDFQLQQAQAHLADLRAAIQQQLRDSLIDVRTAEELVSVAKSNQELARTTLEQASERFQAGIEDNLPTIEAAATTAQALTQYATAVFQLNQARLTLARNLGLLDTEYRPDIPGGRPTFLAQRR